MLGFTALQYESPGSLPSRWGDNFAGVGHFQRVLLGTTPRPSSPADYRSWSWTLLVGAWEGYALALVAGLAGGVPRARKTLPMIAALAVVLAVACPASLSYDVYCYVAFARMPVLYGLNPYVTTPHDLVPLGDATAPVVGTCEMRSVYGPAWTLLCVAEVAALRHAGLWWQVAVLKLVEAAGLVLAAAAGRSVAEHYHPGRGDLTALAIGLNPLLLIEGPANGHSDLVMIALVLGAAALALRGRWALGDLTLGISIGFKFLPLALVPWLILERFRGQPWPRPTRRAAATLLLTIGPTVLAYVPLWRGAETFSAIQTRATWGTGPDGPGFEAIGRQLFSDGFPEPVIRAAGFVLRQYPVVIAYLALTAWIWLGRTPGRWLDAWVVLSLGFVTWTMAARYPWYMAWPLPVALTRWGRVHVGVSALCLAYSFYMQTYYLYRTY
jgi:hypothetical protein